jgi:rhodanese-related sulfurtransferase
MSAQPDPAEIDVSAAEVADFDRSQVQIVDVREPHEWAAGRIAGAVHVPMQELGAAAETLDHDRPVVFYCRVGGRSRMAADAFRGAGFQAHSMAGGLQAWAARGLPLDPDGGTVADH